MKTGRTFVLALTLLALAWGMASAESVPPEIPKPGFGGTMTASAAASYLGTVVGAVIDGTPADALGARWSGNSWERPKEYAWLRIDLGLRYRVQKISIAGDRPGQGPDSVKVFVTDSDVTSSAPPAAIMPEWGDALVDDTWPADGTEKSADLLGTGRYVIIYTNGLPNGLYIKEVWLYGVGVDPAITAFSVSDSTSGSTTLTDSTTVDVSITATQGENAIAGYLVTETSDVPDPGAAGWTADPPTTYTFTATEEMDVSLWAWVKDSTGVVTGFTPRTIHYQPPAPVTVTSVEIYGQTETTAVLQWTTDIACLGREQHREQWDPPDDWIVGSLDATPTTRHFRVVSGLALGSTYDFQLENNEQLGTIWTYVHESTVPEIPKPGFGGTMAASAAASYLGTVVGAVIDGTPADALGARWSGNSWERPKEYAWLRIDLGLRYRVQKISIAGDRPGQGPDSVKVFVTDSDVVSGAPPAAIMPEWGDALVDDTWPADGTEKSADLLGTGRYVIIYTNGLPNGLYIKEVWLYGVQLERKPTVTAFTIADLSTGSHLFTNEATVNVSISSEPSATETPVAAVLVTETADKPPVDDPNWSASITSYTIAGPEGSRALYAWAKDTADAISDAFITTIYFSTATPAVSGIEVTDNGNGTATAEWATDNPAEGSMKYGSVSILGATPNVAMENAFRTSHSVTFPIAAGTNYKIILVNNEIASPAIYWPLPWPIDGDANMDCRVNILDLIFIRNKLNQPVGTGDNWKADVNEDTRINILDLIFVRNKLNTQCP